LYLVKIDDRWFVAGESGVTTKPDALSVDLLTEPLVIPEVSTPFLLINIAQTDGM